MNNPFKTKGKKGNQGTFIDEYNLKVTLPAETPLSRGAHRTTGATGSSPNLSGDSSNLKRDREESLDDKNPPKKLNDQMSPKKSTAKGDGSDNDPDAITVVEETKVDLSINNDANDISDVESIQTNLTEKELIEHVEQVSLNDNDDEAVANYAGAAKKPKLDLPDLVYIQKGTERREPIQKAHFDAFIDDLLQNIMKLPSEQSSLIEIDWHGWGLGRGVIACLNPKSASYVKKIASDFSIRDLKFRAWSKNEFGKREIFSGRLPGVTWKSRKPLETVKWIFNFNGLKNADFHLLSYIKTPQGVIIRFESSRDLTLALRRRKYVLNVGIAKLRLECRNAESSPVNSPSEPINLEKGDDNNSPNVTVEKQS